MSATLLHGARIVDPSRGLDATGSPNATSATARRSRCTCCTPACSRARAGDAAGVAGTVPMPAVLCTACPCPGVRVRLKLPYLSLALVVATGIDTSCAAAVASRPVVEAPTPLERSNTPAWVRADWSGCACWSPP